MWTEIDYCLCGNSEECEKKDKCFRADIPTSGGYYSCSNFFKENKECKFFMNKEKNKK